MTADIAIIGAMPIEVARYVERMDQATSDTDGGVATWAGQLFGRTASVTCSGVGKVMAAAATQRVIDRYAPTAILMVGVAGALSESLRIGDVVIGSAYIQHDVDAMALGLSRGALPEGRDRLVTADRHLLDIAVATGLAPPRLSVGHILSGDQFLTDEQTLARTFLFDDMAGIAIDMESAASAAVCAINQTAFLSIRSICSELTGSQEEQFERTLGTVVNNALPIVEQIFERW